MCSLAGHRIGDTSNQENESVDGNISWKQRLRFHEFIAENKFEEVKRFVEENSEIHYAYDQDNKSALTKALESKSFRIYSFLRSKGFSCGIDQEHANVFNELSIYEKNYINLANREFFHSSNSAHISELLSKSQLAFRSIQNNFDKIRSWFETLDKIPKISDILKLVATAETLIIVFDFNSNAVSDIDPTQTNRVTGRTVYKDSFKGVIMIGAKSEDIDILATMAHEFTHLAMHLVFADYGNPYFEKDREKLGQFQKIIDFCRNDNGELPENQIIDNVFECYNESEHAKELIVRVPQLLAYYMNDPIVLADFEETYKDLFNYFNTYTMKMVREEIEVAKPKQMIASLNKQFGVYSKVEMYHAYSQELAISLTDVVERIENIFIQSNVPDVTLNDLIIKLKESGLREAESTHVFVTMDQFLEGYALKTVFDSAVKPKIFVIHNSGTDFPTAKLTETLKYFPSRVVLIAEQDFLLDNSRTIKIVHEWIDLSEHSQINVLNGTIEFFDNKFSLKLIMEREAKLLNKDLQLAEILKLHKIDLQPQTLELLPQFVPRAAQFYQKMDSVQYIETISREHQIFKIPSSVLGVSFDENGKREFYWHDLPSQVMEDLVRQFTASLEKTCEPIYIFLEDIFISEKPRQLIESAFRSVITRGCELKNLSQSGKITSELVKSFKANKHESQLYRISKQVLSCDILVKGRFNDYYETFEKAIKFEVCFVENSEVMQSNRSCTIMTDSAGWGKTTFATHFAKEFQQKHPTTWTVFVDLKQHTTAFEKDGSSSTIKINSEYIGRTFAKLNERTELKLFEHFFEAAKVFLIFDGFDEVSPNYKTFALNILICVQNSGNKFIVTTRTHLTKELEEVLGVEAIQLMPFTKNDRKEFLEKFLRLKFPESSEKEIAVQIDVIMKKIGNSDFLEVPLHHLMMIETILADNSSEIEQINRYSLYNYFVKQKIKIWVQRGPLAVDDNATMIEECMNVLQMHQKVVLEFFFDRKITNTLGLPDLAGFCTPEMICRIGLLQQLGRNTLQCVHLTFTEYLVANFVLANLEKPSHLTSFESLIEIFCSIFTESNDQFKGVRKFIDEGIRGGKTKRISFITTKQPISTVLNCSVIERLVNVTNLILNTPEQSREVKVQMLDFLKRKWGYAVRDFGTFSVVWKCIGSVYEGDGLKKYLFQQIEPHSENILFSALEYSSDVDVLESILDDVTRKLLTPEEFFVILQKKNYEKLTPLTKAASGGNFQELRIFWNAIKTMLDDEKLKKLLSDLTELLLDFTVDEEVWNYTELVQFWIDGPGYETARKILYIFEDIFKSEDSRQLSDNKQFFISVCIWFSCCRSHDIFIKFWSFIKNNFDQKAQKLIFLERNAKGFNFLNGTLNNNKCSITGTVATMVLDTLFELFEPSEIRRASKVTGKSPDYNHVILDVSKYRHGLGYVKDFFRIPVENGRALLHEVAEFSHDDEVVRKYIKFANDNFESQEIKEMLLLKDHDSRIPLQNCELDQSVFLEFSNFYRQVFGDRDFEELLFEESRKIFLRKNRFPNNFKYLKNEACELFGKKRVMTSIALARKSNARNRCKVG